MCKMCLIFINNWLISIKNKKSLITTKQIPSNIVIKIEHKAYLFHNKIANQKLKSKPTTTPQHQN